MPTATQTNAEQRSATVLTFCAAILGLMFLIATAHAQTYTVLHNFTGGLDGEYPEYGLTLAGSANLFGGSAVDAIFRLSEGGFGWIFSPIFEFNGTNGYFMSGRFTVGPDGALYGASGGGGNPGCSDGIGCGLIFKMTPPSTICKTSSCSWTETILYQFKQQNDGFGPNGGLVFDAAGNIYGTTTDGGTYNAGTVFELSPSRGSWTETILYNFYGDPDGKFPNGNLIIDRAGHLIGTTQIGAGGSCIPDEGCGMIFELTYGSSGWTKTNLHNFTGGNDGGFPGGLISDAAGNLYGGTYEGGSGGGGTVYELTPANGRYSYQVLYSFNGYEGGGPSGLLAWGSDGKLYGATSGEGVYGYGSVFQLTPSNGIWTYTDLFDFDGTDTGRAPLDGPTIDTSGNLYGTTDLGGSGSCSLGCGLVYKIAQ